MEIGKIKNKQNTHATKRFKLFNLINLIRTKLYNFYKIKIVYRLFWGRSNLYKNFIHFSVIILSAAIVISGFSSRVLSNQKSQESLAFQSSTIGNVDILEQGGNIQSILLAATTRNFEIIEYKVQEGDTFQSIADKHRITKDSLKLSNIDQFSYYDEDPKVGATLYIPEINGILIKVVEGETLDKIVSRLKAGNEQDVIEINNLKSPDYKLPTGDRILVPDGIIDPPPPPVPQATYFAYTPQRVPIPSPSEAVLNGVYFIDPLYMCNYGYARGFSSWHNGIDLLGPYGCPIAAAAAGVVEYAGWSSGGEGFMVRINHGNGVKTLYFHGNGEFFIRPGETVSSGQHIMNMGCTGYCTGNHLHLSLKLNEIWIDSAPYIPYWRP